MVTYTRSVSTDFGGNIDILQFSEIVYASVISTNFTGGQTFGDVVELFFSIALTGPQIIILDGLISAYTYNSNYFPFDAVQEIQTIGNGQNLVNYLYGPNVMMYSIDVGNSGLTDINIISNTVTIDASSNLTNAPFIVANNSSYFPNSVVLTAGNGIVINSNGNLLNIGSAGAENIFSAVDTIGNLNIDAGWTDIPLNIEKKKTSNFTHLASNAEVTVNQSGTYIISGYISTRTVSGTNSSSRGRLVANTGSGYTEISGTCINMSSDTNGADDRNTGAFTIALDVVSGTSFKLQAERIVGTATLSTWPCSGLSIYTPGSIGLTGAQGPQGIQGNSNVTLSSVGTVANGQDLVFDGVGPDLYLKRIKAGNSITLDSLTNEVVINANTTLTVINITSTTSTNIASTTFITILGMTTTPPAGTYLVQFSASALQSQPLQDYQYILRKAGVDVASSLRYFGYSTSVGTAGNSPADLRRTLHTQAVITVNGSETITAAALRDVGTFTIYDRSLILLKI